MRELILAILATPVLWAILVILLSLGDLVS
jgi:hypothetical protein